MTNHSLPIIPRNRYNRSKVGIYGNLGRGSNADILYLETVLSVEELNNIRLISDIPDSETWDVKDLFQRDVDGDRVHDEIIPYFKDDTKIKYFSPLTLILLPLTDGGRKIMNEVEYISPFNPSVADPSSSLETVYEKVNHFKLNIYRGEDSIAQLEWNENATHLVAIDGQHRLSALRRWRQEPNSTLNDWKVPVVILNIFKVDPDGLTINLLELVRKTFVYLNTKSERINSARVILLNDESVNAICTQEIIQHYHSNDNLPIESRKISRAPLIFFDWQGKVENKKRVPGPASLISVEEIYHWFEEYLLGDDGGDLQKIELYLEDLIPQLEGFGPKRALSHSDANRIRLQFNNFVAPGIFHLIENFTPYKNYINQCRDLEISALERSDNAKHAFKFLRFGSHNAPPDQARVVDQEVDNLKISFEEAKKRIDSTIRQDIGMRGIVFAFSELRRNINHNDWEEFSEKFTHELNLIYDSHWFRSFDDLTENIKGILTYLIFDEAGSIINYKYQQAKDGLGSILIILVANGFYKNRYFGTNVDWFDEIWNEYSNNLRKTYEKGLRRYFKARLSAEGFVGTPKEYNEKAKNLAEQDSLRKVESFFQFLPS